MSLASSLCGDPVNQDCNQWQGSRAGPGAHRCRADGQPKPPGRSTGLEAGAARRQEAGVADAAPSPGWLRCCRCRHGRERPSGEQDASSAPFPGCDVAGTSESRGAGAPEGDAGAQDWRRGTCPPVRARDGGSQGDQRVRPDVSALALSSWAFDIGPKNYMGYVVFVGRRLGPRP